MADTPKIRFKGFTEAWEQRKLGTIISEKLSNGVINKSGTQFSNVKHINVINMYTPDKIHTDDLTPSSHDENTIYKCNVEVGDIFMTRSSLKPEGIAEANVLLDPGRYVFDDHLIRMKVDKFKYDPIFVKINLGNKMIKTQFVMKSKTTAFTTIGQEDILECDGMFPLFDEQTKIGKFFQKLENLITLHQCKCDEIKELKNYMLQKMFPQNGQKIPEIRFAGFTEDWEQHKFSEFTFPAGEKNKNNLPLEPYAITNEQGFIAQKDAHDDFGYMRNVDRTMYIIVKPNSFAYNPARINVGSLGYYEGVENVIVSSLYEVFQTVDDVDDKFLNHWFKTKDFMDWIERLQEGSVRQYFYYDKLCECKISMPSLEEQEKIASYFDHLDDLITLHQNKCNELREVKKFMLQNMFPQKG